MIAVLISRQNSLEHFYNLRVLYRKQIIVQTDRHIIMNSPFMKKALLAMITWSMINYYYLIIISLYIYINATINYQATIMYH